MRKQLIPFLLLILFCFTQQSFASNEENFTLQQGKNISLVVEKNEEKVVHLAIDLLKRDVKSVLDAELTLGGKESHVIIGTIGQSSLLKNYAKEVNAIEGRHEAFLLKVLEGGKLLIAGRPRINLAGLNSKPFPAVNIV